MESVLRKITAIRHYHRIERFASFMYERLRQPVSAKSRTATGGLRARGIAAFMGGAAGCGFAQGRSRRRTKKVPCDNLPNLQRAAHLV